jgi:hypothetical protein
MFCTRSRARRVHLRLCLVLALSPGPAAMAVGEPPPRVDVARIADGGLAAAVERAARGARRRLERRDCQRVLDRFHDGTRRPLRDVGSSGASFPDEVLARVIFRDGRDAPACRAGAAAFTGAGSRVVFVCGNRFARIGRTEAELILIHEMLHTIGLGERPPTSREIDRVVASHCTR